MRGRWIFKGVKFVLIMVALAALMSYVVMRLWNWLMPALFSLHQINFWQAVGLLILSKILFGSLRGRRGPPMYWKGRMMERWAQMTPEEREKFQQGMKGRCAIFGSHAAERKA